MLENFGKEKQNEVLWVEVVKEWKLALLNIKTYFKP